MVAEPTQSVFLNGEYVDRDDARISAFDAGLQHAVGLFETMTGVIGSDGEPVIIGLDEHCERLVASASALSLADEIDASALARACLETVKRSGLDRARVRLTMTGGDLNLLQRDGQSQHRPTLLIVAQPATQYPEAMFEKGVVAAIADSKANPFDPTSGHKTLNYWWRLRELQLAAGKGAAEALIFQVSNHLSGGAVSNLIAIKDGAAITPICRGEEIDGGVPSPVLPGVTRSMVIGWLESSGVPVSKQMVTIDHVLDADEVFMTNSSWGVLPVVGIEAKQLGSGTPGEVSKWLITRWRETIAAI